MNRLRNLMIAACAILALGGASAFAQSPLHGRVSYDAGHSMVKGLNDEAWSHAAINTMILPGDNLWADKGGSTELEFSGGSFVRLADGSKLEVASLSPGVQLRAWEGAFYAHRVNRSTGDVVLETPEAFVDVEQDTNVRIDVVREGGSTVSVRWGRVTVRGRAGGSVIVNEGMRVWVDPGLMPSTPAPYDRTREDAFDTWNRERTKFLAVGNDAAPAAVGITEPALGTAELARYGEWVYIDSRRYWRPTVVVDYVPYRYGYWSTVPAVGNVWVGQYPFCYVTTHYGRWTHHPRHGWVWGYYPGWSPAWCATLRVGDYYVWTPVDYYYRPVVVSSASAFTIGGVAFSIHATSYVPVSRIGYGWTYVSPFNTGLVHYIDTRPTQVNIWNININTNRPHVRVPYQRDFNTVRNYNPPRAIRGPDAFPGRPVQVGSRAAELESRLGRGQFAADRGVRTGANAQTRAHTGSADSRLRQVSLSEERPAFTRATRSAPVSASQERAALRERAGIRDGAAAQPDGRGGAPTISGRGEGRVTREPGAEARGNAERGTISRTPAEPRAESPRGRATGDVRQDASPDRGVIARPSQTPDRAGVDRGAVRQDSGAVRGQGEAPSRVTRTAPDPGSVTRTPARGDTQPGRVERGGTPDRAPARATVPDRGAAVRQAPVTERPQAGRAETQRRVYPGTSGVPRGEAAPSRIESPAPQVETPRQAAPRAEFSAPRVQAPQRVEAPRVDRAPRVEAPSRVQAAPRVEAPGRAQAAPRAEAPRFDRAPEAGGAFAPRQQAAPRSVPSVRAPEAAPRGGGVRAFGGEARPSGAPQRGR